VRKIHVGICVKIEITMEKRTRRGVNKSSTVHPGGCRRGKRKSTSGNFLKGGVAGVWSQQKGG